MNINLTSIISSLFCLSIVNSISANKYPFENIKVREKRHIIFPNGSSFMQMVLGFGLPFEVNKQSVTIGPFIKALYNYPTTADIFTNPTLPTLPITDEDELPPDIGLQEEEEGDEENGERHLRRRAADTRWSFYNTLSTASQFLGYGGKSCVLKAICEAAEIPFSENSGLIGEIFHAILTPSATQETISSHMDYEYLAAEHLGRETKNCKALFSDCKYHFMEQFTKVITHF